MTINKRRKKYPAQNINYFNRQRITKKKVWHYTTLAPKILLDMMYKHTAITKAIYIANFTRNSHFFFFLL